MAINMSELKSGMTWQQSVERFVSVSPWLTDEHLPQLKALYALAGILDKGKTQAALVSQFTLGIRSLKDKRPGSGGDGDGSMPPALPGLDGEDWGPSEVGDDDYGR